jgi:hypothetical protein
VRPDVRANRAPRRGALAADNYMQPARRGQGGVPRLVRCRARVGRQRTFTGAFSDCGRATLPLKVNIHALPRGDFLADGLRADLASAFRFGFGSGSAAAVASNS